MRKITTVLFVFMMLFYGCSEDAELDEEIELPDMPQIHLHDPAIPDDEWGPDALTDVDGIQIEWDANQEDDLAGYKIYRSISSDSGFELIATVSKDANFYEDLDVELSRKYYYRITAFNLDEIESKMSEMSWYTLLPKAQLLKPDIQAVLTSTPTFKWFGIGEGNAYILRVFASEPDQNDWYEVWHCEKFTYDVLASGELEAAYNENELAIGALTPEKEYRWRVDVVGGNCVGSESNWRRFTVQN